MNRWNRIETVFLGALDVADAERAAYLAQACAGDAALQAEIEAMLHAHSDASALALEHRLISEDGPGLMQPENRIGQRIGPYRLLEHIGHGGMADVFLAERADDQYRQQVALKLVRPGLQLTTLVQRFRTERQILARLVHPGIARLLDGGVTEEGQPYLVMEYIDGIPLTDFCDQHRLSIPDRLGLFRQVCQAVQFAHQNLVVHRDLKPSNILVTEKGRVKLLDFGIAKLLNPEEADLSVVQTRSHIRVMTPAYAAPEQVRGEPVQTTTDVYALGVLLYELLTGHRPFQLHAQVQAQIDRIILEEDPKRPSTAVSKAIEVPKGEGGTQTLTPAEVSRRRRTQPEKLRKQLRGDLDNMVMMALRKEPQRRYASAEQLAEDIGRYLENRPVAARKDTVRYRMRKLIQRNKIGTAATLAFALLLMGATALALVQSRQTAAERDRARQEALKAQQVTDFLQGLFRTADPTTTVRDTLQVRAVLEAGAERIETELQEQPAVQAAMLHVIGQAYESLGRLDRAKTLIQTAYERSKAALGADHPDTVTYMKTYIGILALTYETQTEITVLEPYIALQKNRWGDQHPSVVSALYQLGSALHLVGQNARSDSVFEAANALYRQMPKVDDADLAMGRREMGKRYYARGQYEEAIAIYHEVEAMQRRLFGSRHPELAQTLTRLTTALFESRTLDEAEATAKRAIAMQRSLFPEGHRDLATNLTLLGQIHQRRKQFDQAVALLQESIAMRRRLSGDVHFMIGWTHNALAQVYHDQQAYPEAETHYQRAVDIYTQLYGAEYLVTLQRKMDLAALYRDQGRFVEAERMLRPLYEYLRAERGADDTYTQQATRSLIRLYEAWNKPEQAAAYQAQVSA